MKPLSSSLTYITHGTVTDCVTAEEIIMNWQTPTAEYQTFNTLQQYQTAAPNM